MQKSNLVAPFNEQSVERMNNRIALIIRNTTGISPRGESSWRKSKIAARLMHKIKSRRGLTLREVAVADALVQDHSVEERLIEQALDFYVAGCAYAPRKQAWKRKGNYYSKEELDEMLKDDDITISLPTDPVINAD